MWETAVTGFEICLLTQYLICVFITPVSLLFCSTGYYMYIETSYPRVAGDNAKLTFYVSGNKQLSCLKFYYHMYGDTMGTLTVFSGNLVVFSESGNQYNVWLKAERTIYLDYSVSCKSPRNCFENWAAFLLTI